MNIRKIAQNLIDYYYDSRQVGHTNALLDGFRNTDNALFMSATHLQNRSFAIPPKQSLTLDVVERDKLKGLRVPLVIDHHTTVLIFMGLLEDIDKLEAKVLQLENQVKKELLA